VSLINAGSTIGRLLGGIGDKVGRFNVLVVSAFLAGTLLLAFWIPAHTLPAILAFCVTYGFVAGVYIAVVSTCVAQISHVSAIGHRIGLLWALVGFVTLAGPPINGALIAQYPGEQGYRLAGAFSGAVIILGAACGLAARLRSHRTLRAVV
jgi:MFS family permease